MGGDQRRSRIPIRHLTVFVGFAVPIVAIEGSVGADEPSLMSPEPNCRSAEVSGSTHDVRCEEGAFPDRAREASAERSEGRPTRWYGAPILIVDLVSASLVLGLSQVGATTEPALTLWTTGLGIGLAGLGLAGPIVHAFHRRIDRMVASLGLQLLGCVVLPALGAYIDCFGNKCSGDSDVVTVMFGLGSVTASLFDSLLLAHERAAR